MEKQTISVQSKITPEAFRGFAMFYTFKLNKRWRSPLIFALILTFSACGCFYMISKHSQAAMLGAVLLIIGWGLPIAYVISFVSSVNKQIKKFGLNGRKTIYTLHLGSDVQVVSGTESAKCEWEQVHKVYRVADCIYLFTSPSRSFLIPQNDDTDRVWQLICSHLPAEKTEDLRRGAKH